MTDYYQLLIDSMQDIAWMMDDQGHFLLVNSAFLDFYHLTPEQVIGKSYADLVDAPTAKIYRDQDIKVMDTQESAIFEANVSFADNGWVETEWLQTIVSPAINKEGNCIGVIGLSRDISDKKQQIQALEEHQEWMDLYFQVPMVGMAVLNHEFAWVDCNKKLLTLLGIETADLSNSTFEDFLEEVDKHRFKQMVRTIHALKQKQLNLELRIITKQDETRVCEVHLREVEDGLHKDCYVLSLEDVTEHREVTEKLILADQVIEASEEAVLITNADKKIIRVNPAFTRLTGYTEKEVYGKDPKLLSSGRTPQAMYEAMWMSIQQTGTWQGEIWDKRKDGSIYPKWMTISTIYKPHTKNVSHYFAIFSDVTEKKMAENQIRYLAYHDDLTGLANRALFEAKLVKAVEEAEVDLTKLAVMQIDIDNYKDIHDSLGLYVSDALIQAAAVQIRSCLRVTDLVARIGSDEFIILLENVPDKDHVALLASKIMQRFYRPIDVLNHQMHLTVSMGVCIYPEDGQNHEALIRNVDTAMNRAVRDGKNQVAFFTKEMSQTVMKRLRIEYELRDGIQNDEFSLVYQPQVDLLTNTICGVEALIRWEHEDRQISPVDFIPIAEEAGLIEHIGEWVMNKACATLAEWRAKGIDITMAVNISGHQFEYSYLSQLVEKMLFEHSLPGSSLTLEMTEGVLVANTKESLRLINHLDELGCQLAIDDFGTGYSSLSYLKAFSVEQLKVDRSFIMGIPEDHDAAAICTAIINLAQNLNLKTVAEGVETEEQLDFIIDQGCHKVQGYYFAKPMPADAFVQFYTEWAAKSEKVSS